MIKKLTAGEYLKRMTSMSLAEKIDYSLTVEDWYYNQAPLLNGKYQQPGADYMNVIQCSAEWNDAEVEAFEKGARLLTALIGTEETWLPDMFYVKSASRVLRRMVKCLVGAIMPNKAPAAPEAPASTEKQESPEIPSSPGKPSPSAAKAKAQRTKADGKQPSGGGSPVRPKHIDQYVHLLPVATQQKAAKVKELLDGIDSHREQARLLINDNDAVARAQHMTAATKADTQLRRIYKELDAEWDKLVKSGRVVVDDLGNVRVVEVENGDSLTPEQRERVRTLRHFLKDTRRGNGRTREEHIKKWKASYKEMVSIAGPSSVTDKVKEAAQHYGITI